MTYKFLGEEIALNQRGKCGRKVWERGCGSEVNHSLSVRKVTLHREARGRAVKEPKQKLSLREQAWNKNGFIH